MLLRVVKLVYYIKIVSKINFVLNLFVMIKVRRYDEEYICFYYVKNLLCFEYFV